MARVRSAHALWVRQVDPGVSGSTPVLATGLVYLSIGALALVSACLLLAAKPVAKVLWYAVAGLVACDQLWSCVKLVRGKGDSAEIYGIVALLGAVIVSVALLMGRTPVETG